MWFKKSEYEFCLLLLIFLCLSIDLFFEKINRNLNKKTNSNDGKQSSGLSDGVAVSRLPRVGEFSPLLY